MWKYFFSTRPSFFFVRLSSNAFPDIGSVDRTEKKNLKKINHKKSRYRRPWYPRMTLKDLCIWTNKMHNILYKMLLFLLQFFSMLLLWLFFRLKELFQVKNGLTTSFLFFFWKIPKIWVGRTTINGEKKRMALSKSSDKRRTTTFHRSRYREYFMESAR